MPLTKPTRSGRRRCSTPSIHTWLARRKNHFAPAPASRSADRLILRLRRPGCFTCTGTPSRSSRATSRLAATGSMAERSCVSASSASRSASSGRSGLLPALPQPGGQKRFLEERRPVGFFGPGSFVTAGSAVDQPSRCHQLNGRRSPPARLGRTDGYRSMRRGHPRRHQAASIPARPVATESWPEIRRGRRRSREAASAVVDFR